MISLLSMENQALRLSLYILEAPNFLPYFFSLFSFLLFCSDEIKWNEQKKLVGVLLTSKWSQVEEDYHKQQWRYDCVIAPQQFEEDNDFSWLFARYQGGVFFSPWFLSSLGWAVETKFSSLFCKGLQMTVTTGRVPHFSKG